MEKQLTRLTYLISIWLPGMSLQQLKNTEKMVID